MSKTFTDAQIKALPIPPTGRTSVVIPGTPPLELRCYSDGRKAFTLRLSHKGRDKRVTLGSYGAGPGQLSLAAARKAAIGAKVDFEREGDPREIERARIAEAERKRAYTISNLIADWEKHAEPRLRASTMSLYRFQIEKHIRPKFGDRPLDEISRADVRSLVNEIGENSPVAANKVARLLAQLYKFARVELQRDVVNPAEDMKPFREEARQRVLSDAEVKSFCEGLDNPKLPPGPTSALALRFALYSAQRAGEICGMRDNELDLSEKIWTVPASRTKSNKPNQVPLTPRLIGLIQRAQALRTTPKDQNGHALPLPADAPVFQSPADINAPIDRHALSVAMRRLCAKLEMAPASPHDLRRTARTILDRPRLGVVFETSERVLSHVVGNRVSRTYLVGNFLPEKRHALEKLGAELDRIIAGLPIEGTDNVVALERRA